jgi:hypothetical protein
MTNLIFTSRSFRGLSLLFALTIFLTGCKSDEIKIIVPNGYHGQVTLVKSTRDLDQLQINKDGIGYVSFKTYNQLESRPKVFNASGKDLSANLVGYSPSAFWAVGSTSSSESNLNIRHKSFEIVPDSLVGRKQYYTVDLYKVVDTALIK